MERRGLAVPPYEFRHMNAAAAAAVRRLPSPSLRPPRTAEHNSARRTYAVAGRSVHREAPPCVWLEGSPVDEERIGPPHRAEGKQIKDNSPSLSDNRPGKHARYEDHSL